MGAVRYELGFNWATGRGDPFTAAVDREARRRGIRTLRVTGADAQEVRRRADRGRLGVGLFLNTQADATRFEGAHMLLCRTLKSHGTLVIEDPDDARVYTDRALQLEYLQRAGLDVPRRVAVSDWDASRRLLTAAQATRIGPRWVAEPGFGLNPRRRVTGTARLTGALLVRNGFRPGRPVLLSREYRPAVDGGRELRFRVWHLHGAVAPCGGAPGREGMALLDPGDVDPVLFGRLVRDVCVMAGVTGLDWFVTELVQARVGNRLRLLVVEAPNALAGLGPGAAALRGTPVAVLELAAARLVELAWRHARGMPLAEGLRVEITSAEASVNRD